MGGLVNERMKVGWVDGCSGGWLDGWIVFYYRKSTLQISINRESAHAKTTLDVVIKQL